MNDATASYTVQSIFGLMTAHNLSWKIYGYNSEPLTRANYPDTHERAGHQLRQVRRLPGRLHGLAPCPPTSFLEPSWGSTGNSQHPNYDVALGEALIQQVYRRCAAVRAGTRPC